MSTAIGNLENAQLMVRPFVESENSKLNSRTYSSDALLIKISLSVVSEMLVFLILFYHSLYSAAISRDR